MRRSFFVGYEPQRLAGLSPGGGAGTVVIRDIEENKTAVGVPSRYIGEY